MKILIATGIYYPQIGGPATYSKLLYDELPKENFKVEVLSFGDFIDKPKIIRHFLYFFRLLKVGKDADIIYAQDPVSVGLPTLLASQAMGKKFILKIVGDYAWEQSTQRFGVKDNLDDFSKKIHDYSFPIKVLKWIQKYVALRADAIVTPSEYLKKIISNWGINKDKIKVIYNGFSFNSPKGTRDSLRKKYNFFGQTVISAGRLVPWKGFDTLIEAVAEIKKEIPDISLVIVGEGNDRERLEKIAKDQGISDSVLFTGRLDQGTLFEMVKAADMFALNTNYEGFSHQLLETMALGTPVVTTAVGGNIELIEHEKTGLLTAYNDKKAIIVDIMRLIRDPQLKTGISRRAKEKVKQFSDERMLGEISQFLMNQAS